MAKMFPQLLRKSAIAIVDVVIIIFVKIVANEYIRITILIKIGNGEAKTITVGAPINARFGTDIDKMAPIITKQPVPRPIISLIPNIHFAIGFFGMHRLIEKVHIQIPVQIIIEKGRMGTERVEIQPIFLCTFNKSIVALVDV